MQIRLKVLLVVVSFLCLAIFTGKLCAWNGTSLLPPNQHDYHPDNHPDTAENDSSSSFYYGGDEMPDMWQKPRGGFAGTLGEMLITLPLFNQMDREAAKQRFYIISWPVSGGKSEQEVSGEDNDNEEKPAQTTASFEYRADRKISIRKPDEEQPPDDDQDHHTHIGEGNHCYASGCNGGRCQCNECSASLAERPANKKIKHDESSGEVKSQPVTNALLQQLIQRETEGTPLSASLLASLSQSWLSSGIHNPEYRYDINEYAFNNIRVLPGGRIVSCWGDSGTLTVWSPQTFMPQGHSYAQFYTNPGVNTHNRGAHEITYIVFFTDFYAHESVLPQPVSSSHFVHLSGHTAEICGVLVKRDGRIVTWSKDQTIRIWTEHNGHWSSVKIELNREVYDSSRLRELSDGRLLLHSPSYPSQITLILFEHRHDWGYETFNGFVEELNDGRLYQWTRDGLRIWRQNSKQDPTYLRLNLPDCFYAYIYLQLDDGRIITKTMEGSLIDWGIYIRLWTEQRNRTWTSNLIGQFVPVPRGIIPVNNRRIVLYGAGYFVVISEAGGQWIASDRINIPMDSIEDHISVLRNGQIVTTGDYSINRRIRAMIWTEHQNQWHPESLFDESGTPVTFDHVTILRDGRWVSWSKYSGSGCEIRIWAYTDNRYSSTVLSNMPDVDQVIELPGGWLAAVSRSICLSTLKVWTLYPEQDKPHKE